VADTPCLFIQGDRPDMKLLDIVNSSNRKFTFFSDCKAIIYTKKSKLEEHRNGNSGETQN
jgi:hypothetical protein